MTIENMLRDDEHLRMLVRILVNTFGVDVEQKVIGYDPDKGETIALDGRQVRISKDSMMSWCCSVDKQLKYSESMPKT